MELTIDNFKTHVLDAMLRKLPCIIDTTDNGGECDSLQKITQYYLETGRLLIWSGESGNTIYDSAYYNTLFRAWHDFHHIDKQLPFTPAGEAAVTTYQKLDIDELNLPKAFSDYAKLILDAEITEQINYYTEHGDFAHDQRTLALSYIETNLKKGA